MIDEYEATKRKEYFNVWFAEHSSYLGYYKIPSNLQGLVHEIARRAFNAGDHYQRKLQEPVRVGGHD